MSHNLADSMGIHIKKANNELSSSTDSYSFGKVGIPAVHVFTSLKSHYHHPEDDTDLLDYNGMSLICNYMGN